MSDKEKVARFVTRLTRLTNEGALEWDADDPRRIVDQLHLGGDDKVTSSVYETGIDGIRIRLYSYRTYIGDIHHILARAAVAISPVGKPREFNTGYALEFVNKEGYSAAEYTDLPGLSTLFDLVRRKTSGIDEKLTAFMEKETSHAERHH